MYNHLINEQFNNNIEHQTKELTIFEIAHYSLYEKPQEDTHLAEDYVKKKFPSLRKHLANAYINEKWRNQNIENTDGSQSNENTGCAFTFLALNTILSPCFALDKIKMRNI